MWNHRRVRMLTIIGDIGYDIINIKSGTKKNLGGSGYHTLIGTIAAKKKLPILVACVGRDFDMVDISKWGISTEHLMHVQNEKTTRFLINYDGDTRDVVFEMGGSKYLCLDCIDAAVKKSTIVHLAATDPERQIKYIEKLKCMGYEGRISVDVFDQFCRDNPSRTLEVLDECDILFMSTVEQRLLHYICFSEEKLFVLKKGEDGAECFYRGKHFISKCPHVDTVIDTTGAGDILAGVFLSLIDSDGDIETAINTSVALATKSVQFPGSDEFVRAIGSIPDFV